MKGQLSGIGGAMFPVGRADIAFVGDFVAVLLRDEFYAWHHLAGKSQLGEFGEFMVKIAVKYLGNVAFRHSKPFSKLRLRQMFFFKIMSDVILERKLDELRPVSGRIIFISVLVELHCRFRHHP